MQFIQQKKIKACADFPGQQEKKALTRFLISIVSRLNALWQLITCQKPACNLKPYFVYAAVEYFQIFSQHQDSYLEIEIYLN